MGEMREIDGNGGGGGGRGGGTVAATETRTRERREGRGGGDRSPDLNREFNKLDIFFQVRGSHTRFMRHVFIEMCLRLSIIIDVFRSLAMAHG